MRFIDRLLGKPRHLGDEAVGDWTPPPARVERDWAGWIGREERAQPEAGALRPARFCTGPMLQARIHGRTDPPLAFPDDEPLRYLTTEEMGIVRQQQRECAAKTVPPRARRAPPQPVQPEAGATGLGWQAVLRSHAEHLTDEEILVLREQLST